MCRLKASSIAFDGTFGTSSSRRTNGCDHAQSEHLQFEDAPVGHRIFRVVSTILSTLRSFPPSVLFCGFEVHLPSVPTLSSASTVSIPATVAVLAIHRPVASGLKWYCRLLPARRTCDRCALCLTPVKSSAPALLVLLRLTAGLAAFRNRIPTVLEERLVFP